LRLPNKRHGLANSGVPSRKKFLLAVPETRVSRRSGGERSAPAPESGTFALRVLWTLPQAHQAFVFHEIRGLCRHFLHSKPEDASEISSEELVSEVWAKLIGSITMPDPNDAAEMRKFPDPSEWTIDAHVPENDGRVIWLIREIGGLRALAHRCEDIRRRRWGRATPSVGRPMVQPSEFPDIETAPDEGGLGPADAVNIWRGVLITAKRTFQPDDDVCKLLRMLTKMPKVLEGSHGSRWPVGKLVTILNAEFSPPLWSDDRVENAKKRLLNWVQRLMRQNGLDATDLEAVFARVARQQVQQQMPAMGSSEANLQS
jgi:hypothetical protein